jgi:hypothetical protein
MKPGDLVTPLDERVDLWPTHSGKIRSYPVSSPFNYGEVGTVLEVVEDDNNAFSTMKKKLVENTFSFRCRLVFTSTCEFEID